MRAALNGAVRAGLISVNPGRYPEPPKASRPRPQVWTPVTPDDPFTASRGMFDALACELAGPAEGELRHVVAAAWPRPFR
jgi:hypothetical protein